MARQVEAKKAKKADATESSRLVNSPKPLTGKPKIRAPCFPVFSACVNSRPRRLEYKSMASSAQIQLWHAEKVATQVEVSTASNGIHYAAWGETRIPEGDLERLVGAVPAAL